MLKALKCLREQLFPITILIDNHHDKLPNPTNTTTIPPQYPPTSPPPRPTPQKRSRRCNSGTAKNSATSSRA